MVAKLANFIGGWVLSNHLICGMSTNKDKILKSSKIDELSGELYGVGGVMVSIVAFQAVDPGSIPGRRNYFY